jgi:hypothetical protein
MALALALMCLLILVPVTTFSILSVERGWFGGREAPWAAIVGCWVVAVIGGCMWLGVSLEYGGDWSMMWRVRHGYQSVCAWRGDEWVCREEPYTIVEPG